MIISPTVKRILPKIHVKKNAVLTGGGLCPGINTVIHQLNYNLKKKNQELIGIKHGYSGIINNDYCSISEITNKGSCLGMSRETYDVDLIAESLVESEINQLFVIGGDGSLSVAHELSLMLNSYNIQIIGIPKTIDNDIPCIDHSFGFYSAVDSMTEIIECANIEATNYNTVSIVETMGRNSGYLAAYSAAASNVVDICVIPEYLKDISYYCDIVQRVYNSNNHCNIVVSEGCGQEFIQELTDTLRTQYPNLKYIKPGYIVRNAKLNSYDTLYCKELANGAIHLSELNCTDCMIGMSMKTLSAIPLVNVANKNKKLSIYNNCFDYIKNY